MLSPLFSSISLTKSIWKFLWGSLSISILWDTRTPTPVMLGSDGRGLGLLQTLPEPSVGYCQIGCSNLASGGPHDFSSLYPSQCPVLFSQSSSFSLVINHANCFLSTLSILMLVPSVHICISLGIVGCRDDHSSPPSPNACSLQDGFTALPIKASFSERLVYNIDSISIERNLFLISNLDWPVICVGPTECGRSGLVLFSSFSLRKPCMFTGS